MYIAKAAVASFQLTAARRRLVGIKHNGNIPVIVSTHSRPKAAGYLITLLELV